MAGIIFLSIVITNSKIKPNKRIGLRKESLKIIDRRKLLNDYLFEISFDKNIKIVLIVLKICIDLIGITFEFDKALDSYIMYDRD